MRQCTSNELGGRACETDNDGAERFQREFRVEDIHVLAEGEVEEDLIEISVDHNMAFSSKMISRYTFLISYYLYWQYIRHISNFCMVTGFESILGPLKKSHEIYRDISWSTLTEINDDGIIDSIT
jgi:hypothetical protein